MPVATMQGREIHVDEEGFLTDPSEWDEELAKQLAANIGLELTDRHYEVIRFAREDAAAQGETPTLRRMQTVGGFPPRSCSSCSPRSPPRSCPTSPGCRSPSAASDHPKERP
jgi:Rod binding domain-containing protein